MSPAVSDLKSIARVLVDFLATIKACHCGGGHRWLNIFYGEAQGTNGILYFWVLIVNINLIIVIEEW